TSWNHVDLDYSTHFETASKNYPVKPKRISAKKFKNSLPRGLGLPYNVSSPAVHPFPNENHRLSSKASARI
ncbi:MAG: hypothetical protein WD673_13920, partial [Alphaproteobacteria bacterium]